MDEESKAQRRRRSSARYSASFNFDELSELGSEEEKPVVKRAKNPSATAKGRLTKECPGCSAEVALSVKACPHCEHPFRSASKSHALTEQESAAIRERFSFEPDKEDDGTLKIDKILGRRRRKISGRRWISAAGQTAVKSAIDTKFDYEYLLKYKGMSYLHVQWLGATEIEGMGQKSRQALNRYLNLLDRGTLLASEDGDFDASYCEVERILDVKEEEVEELVVEEENPDQSDEEETNYVVGAKIETDRVGGGSEPAPAYSALAPRVESIDKSVSSSNSNKPATSIKPDESTTAAVSELSAEAAAANTDQNDPQPDMPPQSESEPMQVEEQTPEEVAPPTIQEIYKPALRCQKVLEKIWDDHFAGPFQDPVDTDVFGDYLEVVFEPMCLNDIKTKLDNNEYKGNVQAFARDMRLVWKNCKIYNVHKSQIWNAAHYLSMVFERLFQSWVISFADGKIPLSDPIARPWESTCRVCLSDHLEEQMMLCDHCDAAYHIFCLNPPLQKVPDGAWVCLRCSGFVEKDKSRMLSASLEEKAREDAENATTRRIKRVKKKKYLVKWRGLSYKECTWETPSDIGNDEAIAEFHRINDEPPDEPPLTQDEIVRELSKRQHAVTPAMVKAMLEQEVQAQAYAQIRSFHFLRWNDIPPDALLKESGPDTHAYVYDFRVPMCLPKAIDSDLLQPTSSKENIKPSTQTPDHAPAQGDGMTENELFWYNPDDFDPVRADVAQTVSELIHHVARGTKPLGPGAPLQNQEVQVCLKKGMNGLFMNIGDCKDRVVVLGFRSTGDGKQGAAEASGQIKVGDILVAINGQRVTHLRFQEIIKVLQRTDPYIYLRFFRPQTSPFPGVDPSEGTVPIDPQSEQKNRPPKPITSRFRGVVKIGNAWAAQIWYDGSSHRLGLFEDEMAAAQAYDEAARKFHGDRAIVNFLPDGTLSAIAKSLAKQYSNAITESKTIAQIPPKPAPVVQTPFQYPFMMGVAPGMGMSAGLGMGVGIGTATDAAPEEDEEDDVPSDASLDTADSDTDLLRSSDGESDSQKSSRDDNWDSDAHDGEWRPKEETEMDGPLGRLVRAVNESDIPPERKDWEEYVIELGYNRDSYSIDERARQVEQVDISTGEVIKLWDSLAGAARSLNIPPSAISAVIRGKNEHAGGFKWRYVAVAKTVESTTAKEDSINSKLYQKTKIYKRDNTLRDYQLEGLNWLLRCWYGKRSCILADEMGLGKTVQIVCFLEHLFEVENMKGPFLVAVPLSTIEHWKREVEAWSNMNLCVYHDTGGGKDMRDVIREFEWYYKGRSKRLLKFHVLVTTYDDLIKDHDELSEVPWRVVIVDEAHRLRNVNSKLLESLKSIVQRGINAYGYQHRILMTGTPLQNNTQELWSLLNFIEPAKFPDMEIFYEKFGVIRTQDQVEQLQRRLTPHLLRRVKEDVAADIPPKEETVIDVELTTMQKQYYRAIFEHNHAFLMQGTKGSLPKLMNIQMELRKCCNHPFLINGVEEKEMDALIRRFPSDGMSEKEYRIQLQRRRVEELVVPSSGKLVLIDKLLPKLKREGHKLLIFSQMVRMLDLLEEYCDVKQYNCERLDGRVQGNERQLAIDRFNRSPESFVFLLSTRAGGVGINLTAADTVIIFDSDWNPQNDIQAQARCHRIGQTNTVSIYRLITRRSFESEMFERASMKLGLEQAVLGTNAFSENKGSEKMDSKEMEQLLRQGAYAILLEDESAIKEFCDKDIEKILEERSHIRVVDGPNEDNWFNKKKKLKTRKSLFTGASSAEHADIDVNDPDFWRKVLPDLVTPDMMQARLDKGEAEENDDSQLEFFQDLQTMVEGMQDLMTKGQLPERERNSTVNLLLQISLKEAVFTEKQRRLASEWQAQFEGTRNRTKKTPGHAYNGSDSEYDGVTGRRRKGKAHLSKDKGRKGEEDWDPETEGTKKKSKSNKKRKRGSEGSFADMEGEIKRAAAAVRRYRRPSAKKRSAVAAVELFLKTQDPNLLTSTVAVDEAEAEVEEAEVSNKAPTPLPAAPVAAPTSIPDGFRPEGMGIGLMGAWQKSITVADAQPTYDERRKNSSRRKSSRRTRRKKYSEYAEGLEPDDEEEEERNGEQGDQDDDDEDYDEFADTYEESPVTRRETHVHSRMGSANPNPNPNTGGKPMSMGMGMQQHMQATVPMFHMQSQQMQQQMQQQMPHQMQHQPYSHPHTHSLPHSLPHQHPQFPMHAQYPMQYPMHNPAHINTHQLPHPLGLSQHPHTHTSIIPQMMMQTNPNPNPNPHTHTYTHPDHSGGYM